MKASAPRSRTFQLWWRVSELAPGHCMATVLAVPVAPGNEGPDEVDVRFAPSRKDVERQCMDLRDRMHARLAADGHSVTGVVEV